MEGRTYQGHQTAMAGRGGPFPFGGSYPRGGPSQGSQVGWGPQGGAGQGAAGPANPVGAGGGYNQLAPPSLPSPFGVGGRWGSQVAPRGAQPNPRSRWGPLMMPRPPQQPGLTGQQQQQPGFASQQQPGSTVQQQPGFAGQQQPAFAGQQQPGFAGQQQPGFAGQQQPGFTGQQQPGYAGQQQSGLTGQQQPGFIGPVGVQGWQARWGGQPMIQGWGPQGGQPPFPLGMDGSRIGQLNPLYDIAGGFSKEAQRMIDRLVKEMGVEGRKRAYESVL